MFQSVGLLRVSCLLPAPIAFGKPRSEERRGALPIYRLSLERIAAAVPVKLFVIADVPKRRTAARELLVAGANRFRQTEIGRAAWCSSDLSPEPRANCCGRPSKTVCDSRCSKASDCCA